MEMVTLNKWVYPVTPAGVPPYTPDDGVGRHTDSSYSIASAYQPNVYRPNAMVENYDSLVWKEAFRGAGTFELKTYDVVKTKSVVPLGTLVSLMDSDEVCIATTHHISTDESGRDVLTVSGVSLLKYLLDNRPTWAYETDSANPSPVNSTRVNLIFQIPDHIAFVLWGGIVFPHSEGGYPTTRKPFELPMNIITPHTAISQTINTKGDYYRVEWPPPIETRLKSVSDILELDQRYGVRTIRPKDQTSLVYRPSLNSLRGEGSTTIVYNTSKLLFDVYENRDLTSGDDRVMLRYDAGDVIKSDYISSIEGVKNAMSIHLELDPERYVVRPPTHSVVLREKDIRLDSQGNVLLNQNADLYKYSAGIEFSMGELQSSVEIKKDDPGVNTEVIGVLFSEAKKYFKDTALVDLLDPEISQYTQYKYNVHYRLGDIILVQGKYGTTQKMLVSEYTRTADSNGIGGFPTLVRWEEPTV